MQDLKVRIFAKLAHSPVTTDECWLWVGAMSNGACPKIHVIKQEGSRRGLHVSNNNQNVRAVMLRLYGAVGKGMKRRTQPRCQNVRCVNPWHIDPRHDKRAMGASRRRKGAIPFRYSRNLCKRGHLLAGENIMLQRGGRKCRLCTYRWQNAHGAPLSRAIMRLENAQKKGGKSME